jgi:hypothetical protein
LPELPPHVTYVFEVIFKKYLNESKTACEVEIVVPRSTFTINNAWAKQCGSIYQFNPTTMRLIDAKIILENPKITRENL